MTRPILVIGNRNYSSWSFRGWLVLADAHVRRWYTEALREAETIRVYD